MKKIVILLVCTLIINVLSAQNKTNKCIIIGIDGARPDATLFANTPHIDSLVLNGAFSFTAQADPISRSGICWTGMLTGVWHEKHNVLTNSYKDYHGDDYPHFYKRLKQANKKLKLHSIVNWSPIHKILEPKDCDILETYGNDDLVTERVVEVIKQEESDVIFVQLDHVDHIGHKVNHSIQRPDYLKSIEEADAQIGLMLDAINERKNKENENWYVIVSTDHGGDVTGHGRDIPIHTTVFYIINGPEVKKGEISEQVNITDIAVTVLKIMGVNAKTDWNLDGAVRGLN
ncbi:hypothetical protein D1614_18780 [Maribellus luteus]|uniref:Metalloenzyme domain-containing protein n=1 Tax=Maribellus luteus TaxID=2305463 RepID=A0A399ST01_9BACT|nr:alkaline phosphatase family protein [Maribellus luteus]RIJ46458.1 hypothetical protein D1614_18780 [Maribellus luteus]